MSKGFQEEKRVGRRIPVNLTARIIISGETYTGVIKNVSENGVQSFITTSLQVTEDFSPKKFVELHFQIPSGETLNLVCEIRWFLRPPVLNKMLTMGMEITDPPHKYREFVKYLDSAAG